MKMPIDRLATRAAERPAVLRHLAFVHITNLAELEQAYGEDAQRAIDSHVRDQLDSAGEPPPTVVFLDGPYILIDLSACLGPPPHNKDALCEHINALLMGRPAPCADDSIFLNVETTLIEWSDKEWQLIRSGEISKLTSRVLTTLRLGDQNKKEKTFKADLALASDLLSRLTSGRLALAFQPVISTVDRRTVLYWESLLRLRTRPSTLEFTSCTNHITAVERLGLIGRLDRSILWTHIDLLQKHPGIKLGCNISAQSLKFDCWWRVLFEELSRQPKVASRLIIEITETSSITDDDEVILLLRTLKLLGCTIAIDDLGSGYSTLNFALRARPDFIKLNENGLALKDGPPRPGSGRIMQLLTQLCRHLSSYVIAEGIESESDITSAMARGAHAIQGYFLARPDLSPHWLNEPAIVHDAYALTHPSHRSSPLLTVPAHSFITTKGHGSQQAQRKPHI